MGKHQAYALLTVVYNALFAMVVRREEERKEPIGAMDFLLLSLATYRLGRLVSYDKVTSWARLPFVTEGEGAVRAEDVQEAPKGEGVRLAIAELITCSWCIAMWIAQPLYFGYRYLPRLTRPFVTVTAISGAEQLLDALFGLIHWTTARERR